MNSQITKALFLVVAILWGSSFAFQKELVDQMGAISFTFWNFFSSGIIFLLYALKKRVTLLFRLREGIVLGILLSGIEIFQMLGLGNSTAANTAFLSNLGMLIIPFLGWLLFKHGVTLENTLAIGVATVGMYFLVGGLSGFGVGEGQLLLSAIFIGLYFLYSERFESNGKSHVLSLLVQQFFIRAQYPTASAWGCSVTQHPPFCMLKFTHEARLHTSRPLCISL